MSRNVRNAVVLAMPEAAYGNDPGPTGANAILIANLSAVPLNANNVDRALLRAYFGASEMLPGTHYAEVSFDVEIVGSGTIGTAPAWECLLLACGFASTVTADRVDYLPLTDAQPSATIYLNDSGVLHELNGARGTVTFKLNAGEKPVMSYHFLGLYVPITAAALPVPDYSGFMQPQIPTHGNTQVLTLGATHADAGPPALTGGTTISSLGLEINVGNNVQFTPMIGAETVDITNREVTGKVKVDATAAQEVARMADVLAGTLSSVGMIHGTVAGSRVMLYLPTAQFLNPSKEELNGRRLIGYDLRGVPPATAGGNNELRVVVCF